MRSALRLDHLIHDVLSYSVVLHSQKPMGPVDLDVLIRDIIATYPNEHKAEFHIQGKLPKVLGNEAFLTQCFSNLLGNASKFMKPGITPNVGIRAEDGGIQKRAARKETSDASTPPLSEAATVRIWVEDNGVGIAAENHERVFRIFERINPTELYEGTGIGLAIVRKAAERMGAKVGFESELGKGSRFWIQLQRG